MSLTSDRDTRADTPDPVPSGAREVVFDIAGMSCASCAARIERRLRRLDGVSARVNLATDTALITVGAEVDPETVVSAIERLGYSARPQAAPGPELAEPGAAEGPAAGLSASSPEAARVAGLWRRLVVALLCGAPLADGSCPGMRHVRRVACPSRASVRGDIVDLPGREVSQRRHLMAGRAALPARRGGGG